MRKPPPPVRTELRPVVYGKTLCDGIPLKQDSRVVIERGYAGHPILIASEQDYVNLYHVYNRRNRRLPIEKRRHLVRQQIGPSQWRLYLVRNKSETPALVLQEHYDPKRGRYRRYADQLTAGDRLVLPSLKEAVKARRAWVLYTPKNERRHLRGRVHHIPGTKPTFVVEIVTHAV